MSVLSEQSLSSLALLGLFCVPLFPLLLFGFGARPPDTSNLPVSTDQLWATGGIVAATSVVALGCFLVPGGLAGIGSWIAGTPEASPLPQRPSAPGPRGQNRVPRSQGRLYQQEGYVPRSAFGAGQAAAARAAPQVPALSLTQQKEAYHLARLRATPLIIPFSEQGKHSAPNFLLSALGALLLLVVVFGQLVKKGYAADASAPPPKPSAPKDKVKKQSVEEEYAAREKRKTAAETPEETARRRAKEKPMWDKRRKEEAKNKPKLASLSVQQMYDAAEKKKTKGETPEETKARREKEKPKWDERFKREKVKAEAMPDEAGKSGKARSDEAEKETASEDNAKAGSKAKLEKLGAGLKRRWASWTGSPG